MMTELTRDNILAILNNKYDSEWHGDILVYFEEIEGQKYVVGIITEEETIISAFLNETTIEMISILETGELKKFKIAPQLIYMVLDTNSLDEYTNAKVIEEMTVENFPHVYAIFPAIYPTFDKVLLCPLSGGKILQSSHDESGSVKGAYHILPILESH